ncbi:MAG: hypothetical protein ABI780_08915 [Ardenticatenales bacterium]
MPTPRPPRFAVAHRTPARSARAAVAVALAAALAAALAIGVATTAGGRMGSRFVGAIRAGIADVGARAGVPLPAVHAQGTASGGPTYALPVVNFFGEDDLCESWIAVQNIGDGPAQPVVAYVTNAPEGTPTPTVTPVPWQISLKYMSACGGLLRPGGTWSFVGAQVASGARSGFVLSLDGATLAAAGADASEGDDDQGARLCQRLKARVGGDSVAWQRFYTAWRNGDDWEGLPLGRMAGPPLAVTIHRFCPGQMAPGSDATSAYTALAVGREVPGHQSAAVAPLARPLIVSPLVYPQGGQLHVQNVGSEAGTFTLRFQAPGACAPLPIVQTVQLMPGESTPFDLARAPAGAAAFAIVEGDRPFAAVGQPAADDWTTVRAVRSEPDTAVPAPALALAAALPLTPGTMRLDVDVVNVGRTSVTPRLTLFGPHGRVGSPVLPPVTGPALCPGAGATLHLTATVAVGDLQAHLAWVDDVGGTNGAAFEASVAVARIAPAGTGDGIQAAYRVEARAVDGRAALAATSPMAVSAAYNDLSNSGIYHVLAIARTGDEAGRWDYALDLYDHNGRTGRRCASLDANAADVIDLSTLPDLLPPGAKSSAVVSGVAFDGAAPGDLAVTALWVQGAYVADDRPGDEWAAAAGVPIGPGWRALAVGAACGAALEPAPAGPTDAAALRAAAFAPVLRNVGQDVACDVAVRITNTGDVPAAVIEVAWGEPGFCGPECAAPLAVRCLPPIAPGAMLTIAAPEGAYSSAYLSLDAGTLDALGIRPGDERTGAAVLCNTASLAAGCDAWRQLWLAWQHGGTFADLPLGALVGPAIAVQVERTCAASSYIEAGGTARYDAPTGVDVRAAETQPDRFVLHVPDLTLPLGATRPVTDVPIVYIQNAGTQCLGAQLTFTADAGTAVRCDVLTLSPGESYAIDIRDCVDRPWHGTVTVASDGPIALVADRHTNPLASDRALPGAPPRPTAAPTPRTPAVPTATSTPPPSAARGRALLPWAGRR